MRRVLSISVFCLFTAPLLAGTISVNPSTPSVAVGQAVNLTVDVSGVTDLYGYQFDIGFDPSVLAATSVTEGPFLATAGPTIFIPGTIDNVGGSISANGDILQSAVSGVNGGGTLLDISFMALATGISNVQIFNLLALDSFGEGLTLSTTGALVTVAGTSATPEPGTGALFGIGVAIIGLGARRFFRR